MAVTAPPPAPRRSLFEDEHQDYRESFRRFLAAEVRPHYEEWERARIVPRELFARAASHGFLAMAVPEEYGGQGVADWRFNVVLTEETARSGVGDAFIGPGLHTDICLPYLLESATEEQKRRWLPGVAGGENVLAIAMTEPGTGSDLAGIRTRARRDGQGWILDGQKTFITNGINADLVIVAARTGEERHGGLSLLVVERGMEGFEPGAQIEKLGQHCSDTSELFFHEVHVPDENVLGPEGSGFMQLVARLVPERLVLAVSAIAGAELAFEMTLAYVKERTAFGRPIGSFQHSRFVMAELKTKLELTRCFVDRTIERHCAGTATVEEAAMAKWWTTELLGEVTDAGLQLHGGYGYTTEYPISKAWVDARITRIYAGTNEIMKELIGRTLGL
ncbi:MAG TPA: acyl-CoA dehydrogenase family protein [Solirubrobacteraceae bacterium]|jgi:alkylation response protein AidB-like acyl-CoA dehydrogenase|nr:acyl-CoA dehydrogenase family protein [Solirubrobacteraceae bacterium]